VQGTVTFRSDSTFSLCHSALQSYYDSCRTAAAAAEGDRAAKARKLQDFLSYKQVFKQCKDHFKHKRGQLLPNVDPHANTLQATFDLDEFVKIVQHGIASTSYVDARDLSMFVSMAQMVGRGDDTRCRLVSELYEPYARRCIGEHMAAACMSWWHSSFMGPACISCACCVCLLMNGGMTAKGQLFAGLVCPRGAHRADSSHPLRPLLPPPPWGLVAGPSSCYLVGFLHLTGKVVGGKGVLRGAVRACNPLLCSQGALARYMVVRWTLQREVLPGPADPAWLILPMWPSRGHQAMGYMAHNVRVKGMLAAVGVDTTKVTHAPRVFAARMMDESGLDEEVRR
jgi:hypothetical protein